LSASSSVIEGSIISKGIEAPRARKQQPSAGVDTIATGHIVSFL